MIGFKLDRHIYRPSHGPQAWPWWRLVTVKVCCCSHDPYRFFWITPISWNIWIYTRWGALCANVRERDGIYRREEIDRLGWFA
jgi:hypothetical protein